MLRNPARTGKHLGTRSRLQIHSWRVAPAFWRVSSHAAAAILALLAATPARADVYGSADHSLVARFEGSEIIRFERRLSTPARLLTRPLEDPSSGSGEPSETYASLAGEFTRITYASPQGAKLKEVYRYYETALQSAGFVPLYNCAGESCSPNSAGADFNEAVSPADAHDAMLGKAKGQRYLAVKLARAEGDVYASLYCVRLNPQAGDDGERVYTNLVIVETRTSHDD